MNSFQNARFRPQFQINESIYNLLPAIVEKPVKSELYKSIYKRKISLESDCGKKGHKTFGQSDLRLRGPGNFLKKGDGCQRVVLEQPGKKEGKDACEKLKKAACPQHDVTPLCDGFKKPTAYKRTVQTKHDYGFEVNKDYCKTHNEAIKKFDAYLDKREEKKKTDFIKKNAKGAASFKKNIDRGRSLVVFTRKGEKYLYDNSGFDKKYSNLNKMGKTPTYIENRKEELARNVNEFNEKLKKKVESEAMKKLTTEERQELLECLEASREKLQMRYQALPLIISSLKTKNARIRLEEQLGQIEKDIRLITAHSQIYVAQ